MHPFSIGDGTPNAPLSNGFTRREPSFRRSDENRLRRGGVLHRMEVIMHNEQEHGETVTHVSTEEARSGSSTHMTRYVLASASLW